MGSKTARMKAKKEIILFISLMKECEDLVLSSLKEKSKHLHL
ncbi:hypothetical protein HMPREF9130_0946 [Peptoniphilus sp. oral taxon 375 str. F0436]|nr:hypothetical protein HMPREF9130_0946 [Peptoniphilus sp. oral taxon 375 str. F0436]